MIFTTQFLLETGERALKTFAQALLAILVVGTPIWAIPWTEGLGIAATATALSVLTSIVSAGVGPVGTPAVVGKHRAVE